MAVAGRSELTGADWFLVAAEAMMRAAGQGAHYGLSVLRLDRGFEIERLRSAAERLAAVSPIAAAQITKMPFGVPAWKWGKSAHAVFPVSVSTAEHWQERAQVLLKRTDNVPICFEVVAHPDGTTTVLFRWTHLLMDGKGVELLLSEIARLAAEPSMIPAQVESWGPPPLKVKGWRALLKEAQKFKDHFYELAKIPICSVGAAEPQRSEPRFEVVEFSEAESQAIAERAAVISRGVFQTGWFMAVVMRMHHAVLSARGVKVQSYQSGCAVQERKRGARHPLWQNQVSQLFFCMPPEYLEELPVAARNLQEQFTEMSRKRLDGAFAVMTRLFRRLPSWLYLRMLRGNSGGQITSFFYSHTGEFMAETATFCGASLMQGCHVPTVCQPPGTGVFFSQRKGLLTATISWREGVMTDKEQQMMLARMRSDLLGT